jgi:hypothetical protein
MKRRILIAIVAALMVSQVGLDAGRPKRYLTKESTADMTAAKSVFIGWVDLGLDDWGVHGYSTKPEWATAVDRLNNVLQRMSQTDWLPGRTVVGAKDLSDQNASAYDLQVRFSDVKIDYNTYQLYLSIHFIDPKTNAELAVIPARAYYGDDWGFVRYLKAALDEVGLKIQVEVLGALQKKRK